MLPTGPEMATAFIAVAAAASTAPLNPAYRADELDFYLTDIGAKAILGDTLRELIYLGTGRISTSGSITAIPSSFHARTVIPKRVLTGKRLTRQHPVQREFCSNDERIGSSGAGGFLAMRNPVNWPFNYVVVAERVRSFGRGETVFEIWQMSRCWPKARSSSQQCPRSVTGCCRERWRRCVACSKPGGARSRRLVIGDDHQHARPGPRSGGIENALGLFFQSDPERWFRQSRLPWRERCNQLKRELSGLARRIWPKPMPSGVVWHGRRDAQIRLRLKRNSQFGYDFGIKLHDHRSAKFAVLRRSSCPPIRGGGWTWMISNGKRGSDQSGDDEDQPGNDGADNGDECAVDQQCPQHAVALGFLRVGNDKGTVCRERASVDDGR